MKIGKRKLGGALLSVLLAGMALAGWLLGGTDLLLTVVLVTLVVGIALVGYMVAQAERRLRANTRTEIQRASAFSQASLAEGREELRRAMARLEDELDRKLQRPSEQAEALLRAINAGYKRLELEHKTEHRRLNEEQARRQASAFSRQSVFHNHAPAEIDALLQVHRRLRLDDPLPLMGGWALSPRGMLQAIELASQPQVSTVVECGSGTSTLFMARALQLQDQDGKRLVALEHLPEYFELTHQIIKQHGLDHVAEVRLAPLEEVRVDGDSYMWYTTSAIEDLANIDLLLVDGPPGSTGHSARYPAYPLLRQRLSPTAVILVDDAERRDEREIVGRWLESGELTEHPAIGFKQVMLRVKSDG